MFITPEVAYVCELLHKYDVLPLECDGHTMVVSCLLDRFCIRLRMWARKTEDNVSLVPHGIFIEDKSQAIYTAQRIANKAMISDSIIDFMTDGLWTKILLEIPGKKRIT